MDEILNLIESVFEVFFFFFFFFLPTLLYLLKIVYAKHLQTEANLKKSIACMELLLSYPFGTRYFHAAAPCKQSCT